MAATNIYSNRMRKSSKKSSSNPHISNPSKDVYPSTGNISWHSGNPGGPLWSDNSRKNISKKSSSNPNISGKISWHNDNSRKNSSSTRGNSSENLHRRVMKQNHHLQNEPRGWAQTWHSGQICTSSSESDSASNSSRDLSLEQGLNSSKNSSSTIGNSYESLHRRVMKKTPPSE